MKMRLLLAQSTHVIERDELHAPMGRSLLDGALREAGL
jgi:hypothetical protein